MAGLGSTLADPWARLDERVDAQSELARERQALRLRDAPANPPANPPRHHPHRAPPAGVALGARVEADYSGIGYFHPATVSAVHPDGTYDLLYDDGLREDFVPLAHIRMQGQWQPPVAPQPREPPRQRERWVVEPTAALDVPVVAGRPRAASGPRERRRPEVDCFVVGSQVQGNWGGLGYWHPAVVTAVLPGGDYMLRYEDGYEESAAPQRVSALNAPPPPSAAEWDGSFGGVENRRNTPLAPRRRQASGVQDAEKVRRQFEQERKARLEVVKLKAEDKRWAMLHGVSGDRGLFQGMIARWRAGAAAAAEVEAPSGEALAEQRITVFVRKRPLLPDEIKAGDFDVVTPSSQEVGPSLVVHEPKTMVDLSKAMDNHTYKFDAVFGEAASNRQIFETALRPMVNHLFASRGHGTCFAYGQTGSGKTVTMEGMGEGSSSANAAGLYSYVAEEVFRCIAEAGANGTSLSLLCGFVEIYRGKCFDLLAKKRKIEVMEDEHGQQCLVGLQQVELESADHMLHLLAQTNRTTRATAQNETSSRSHAILQLSVCTTGAQPWSGAQLWCKLSLVDLAGSEWAAKAQSDDRNNRLDGAEINKSLLCLKECIRALGSHNSHVPFRGSKLTQVLKDSFVGKESRTVMIANISPASASCDHSLNTIRYAQRVKDWQAGETTDRRPREADGRAQKPVAVPRKPAPPQPPLPEPRAVGEIPSSAAQQSGSQPDSARNGTAGAEEVDESEGEELSRSLRWSAAQVKADREAKRLLQAEERMLAAHAAALALTSASLTDEQKAIEAAADGDMEVYVKQLREWQRQRREQWQTIETAIVEYDQQCAREDEARRQVQGVNQPWD